MPLPLMVLILPLLGLLAGLIIGRTASAELTPGKPYLNLLRRAIILLLAFILLWKAATLSASSMAAFLLGIILSFIPRTRYLGIGFAMAIILTLPSELIVLVASLAALYGLPYASQAQPKNIPPFLVLHTALYILPFLLTSTSIFAQHPLFAAVAAGMLVNGR